MPKSRFVAVRALAMSLPSLARKLVRWREGTRKPLRSRFAAVRVRAAHRDYGSRQPRPEEWLLIEWPRQEAEPTRYWLSTLPAHTKLSDRRLARKPKFRMRTKSRGSRWSKKRRKNSSTGRVISRFLLP